jgi:hypothetical protein
MENGNKHGPRMDEELHHEVESLTRGAPVEARAEPEREQQGAADDEPAPDALIHSHEPSRAGALNHDEVELRSDLGRHLRLSDFPARPGRLAECLTERDAPVALVERVAQLPDWEYETVEAVWEAMGGNREERF